MHAPPVPINVRTTYRPDIDGLRAVAVLSVLYFHYGAPLPSAWRLPGGFTGVDVFFVISGFLITSKLNDDIAAGEFSILSFYDRRIRRILPALIAMLALVLFAGKFLLMPGDYMALATSAATAAFGVSNFFFLVATGYFDRTADLLPLLHTWSLAVEEQFYVVWPLLLWVLARRRSRIDVAAMLGGITILGFATALLYFESDPKAAFYMAIPRAWELMIGSLLVFLPPLPRAFGEVATALGLALIGAGFVLVSAASFPGPAALYPCLGAALVIWPCVEKTKTATWLSILSPIGLISYSLYLWHWPVWVFFRIYINNHVPSIVEAAALALVSIGLAILSYFIVERPTRKRRWLPARSVGAGLLASTLLACSAMYVHSADGMPERLSPEAFEMRSLQAMWAWPCPEETVVDGKAFCSFGATKGSTNEKAILWGDSNAAQFAPFLQRAAEQARISVLLYHVCPPVQDGETIRTAEKEPNYNAFCRDTRNAILREIANDHNVKTVILAASWHALVVSMNGQSFVEKLALFERALETTASQILATGKRVVIVATIPQWDIDPVPCVMTKVGVIRQQCSDAERYLSSKYYQTLQRGTIDVFRKLANSLPQIELIVPGDTLCKLERCIDTIDGEFIYRDSAHLRRNLSAHVTESLATTLGLAGIFSSKAF
jgi:peptidoglycan/LPS O-acetylase OafA/YrhL